MVCSACLPPVAGSEAVEQVGIRAGRRAGRQTGVVREIQVNGTRRLTEPASQLGCVVWWFLWMASPGPLEHRYLTCAKVSER
jgi:hypothetical protein